MRYIARVLDNPEVKRLMVYSGSEGSYLFSYSFEEDGGCSGDWWFPSIEDAFATATERYHVQRSDWHTIPDPLADCQHDWIAPARIPGRESGNPQWGKLEVLKDGIWVQVV